MWSWIREILGSFLPLRVRVDPVAEAKVASVLRLDLKSEQAREVHRELLLETLRLLDVAIDGVSREANNYPANPISGLVWMNGVGYGNLAEQLTEHFHQADWLEQEETASALWAKAILSVCAHYPHLVGPPMLANAACHDRLGNAGQATHMYGCVVKDFAYLADSADEDSPNDEDRAALESLRTAVGRLLDRGVVRIDDEIDLKELRARVEKVLRRK